MKINLRFTVVDRLTNCNVQIRPGNWSLGWSDKHL